MPNDLSVWSMVLDASPIVQVVVALLLIASVTSWEVTEAISSSATTTCTMGLASSTMLQTDKSLGIAPLHEKILGDGTRLQRAGIEAGNPHGGIDQLLAAPHYRLPEMYCGTRQTFK